MTSFKDLPLEREAVINYHTEDTDFSLSDPEALSLWIKTSIQQENQVLGTLNFIFCSDNYLHKINVEYLNHDTYTDVITFPYDTTFVEGDIFISIDRIKENATTFDVSFNKELHRVMIHGVLHLMGYGDKTPEEKNQMTLKENIYLRQLKSDISK